MTIDLHNFCFQIGVVAYDNGSPSLENETTVVINIQRNQFRPVFVQTSLSARIPETTGFGEIIQTVFAQDADQIVRFVFIFTVI